MDGEESRINCQVFQRHEPRFKVLTDKINKEGDIHGKIRYAEDLLKEADELLICKEYKEKDIDCENCHTIAGLRKQTAELIVKAKKLI